MGATRIWNAVIGFNDRLWRQQEGVTAIEYGLMAALVAVVIIAALTATGTAMTNMYIYWSSAVIAAL